MFSAGCGSLRSSFLRGGNWNNETNAGLLALNLNNVPGNTNNNIGLRCVVVSTISFQEKIVTVEFFVFMYFLNKGKDKFWFILNTKKNVYSS